MNQPNVPILPSYLDDIRKSLNLRDRRIELFTAPKRFAMLETKEHVPAQISRFTPLPVKEKILQSSILALGRYSSFIKSGLYFIKIHF